MKQLLYSALVSLITGVCFTAGVFAVFLVAEHWNTRSELEDLQGEWVNLPPGVVVAEHQRVDGTPRFTIQGIVANEGNRAWSEIGLEAIILAGQSQMNQCDTTVRGWLRPGERRAFQIECFEVAGTATPENVTYRLSVPHGRAERVSGD